MPESDRYMVIALGNPLRGDDAVAHHAADYLNARTGSRVAVLKRPSLDIADLPRLRGFNPTRLFIVDACRNVHDDKGFILFRHEGRFPPRGSYHTMPPDEYCHLAELLDCRPSVYNVLIAGYDYGHHSGLTPAARENASAAAEKILKIINDKGA